jgi:hypothetical protein
MLKYRRGKYRPRCLSAAFGGSCRNFREALVDKQWWPTRSILLRAAEASSSELKEGGRNAAETTSETFADTTKLLYAINAMISAH